MVIVRPGPASIDPGRCPGGVVLRVYAAPTGRLLLEVTARTEAEAALRAGRDADETFAALHTFERGVCLVAYDGDTGDRYDLNAVLGHEPGVPFGGG